MAPEPATLPAIRVESHLGALWMPAEDEVLLPYVKSTGAWEPDEERLLSSLMRPRTRFLDVGANVGYFSMLAAKNCPNGTIDAIEPDPRNLALLRLNLWTHAPHATVWPLALGAARGTCALSVAPHNPGDTRTSTTLQKATLLAAMATADELFADRTFDLIKIDVQGFEADVLAGMRGLIARNRELRIVAEFFPRAIEDRGLQPAEVLRGYRALGLSLVACIGPRLEPMADEALLQVCSSAGRDGFVNLLLRR